MINELKIQTERFRLNAIAYICFAAQHQLEDCQWNSSVFLSTFTLPVAECARVYYVCVCVCSCMARARASASTVWPAYPPISPHRCDRVRVLRRIQYNAWCGLFFFSSLSHIFTSIRHRVLVHLFHSTFRQFMHAEHMKWTSSRMCVCMHASVRV